MLMKPLLIAALSIASFFAGLCVNARYDLRIWSGVPVRFDRWTGRSQVVYPAPPNPMPSPPFDPDAYLAGK